ncbi:MAG TPA: hypothetical protein VIV11_23590 [Kofleriaceae bacterium]
MRVLAGLALLAGCAQGGRASVTTDADLAPLDGTIEHPVDAAIDARPIDAKLIDAPPPPPDAPPPPPDAPPITMPDAYQCTVMSRQLLVNPVLDLDANGTGWVQQNIDNAYPIITSDGFAAHTAPYKAWLGGWTGLDKGVPSVSDQLHQDIAIPAGTTMLRLTGQYAVGTAETAAIAYDTGQLALVQTNGTPIEVVLSLTNLTPTTAWTAIDRTFANPAALSGQTVRLRMTSTNDITDVTNFFFDSFALTVTYCQ